MKNSYKFFENRSCKYFPCHKGAKKGEFNCLFCFCPLYSLGNKCGDSFEYVKGIKVCSDCPLPHKTEFYDVIISKLIEINESHKKVG